MKTRMILSGVVGAFFFGSALTGSGAGQYPGGMSSVKDIEKFLSSARVVLVEKDVEAGRSVPWRVTLDDGRVKARAMFKHIDRRVVQTPRHSFRYELAAYSLSRLLDLEIVPPAVERVIEGTTGSLQWYVEDCRSERDRRRLNENPPDLDAFLRRLEIIQIFEALANDEIGDQDDTLIHLETWKICRIDFSAAFRPAPAISSSCTVRRCSRTLFHRLEDLKRPVIVTQMKPYLDSEEIDALFHRLRQFVDLIKNEIREKGEASVLFDEKSPTPGERLGG